MGEAGGWGRAGVAKEGATRRLGVDLLHLGAQPCLWRNVNNKYEEEKESTKENGSNMSIPNNSSCALRC